MKSNLQYNESGYLRIISQTNWHRHTYTAEASVVAMEEDKTPCVFENHMQVAANLVEMHAEVCFTKWSSCRNRSKLWRHCTSDVSAPNQPEIVVYLSSFTWILQKGKKCVGTCFSCFLLHCGLCRVALAGCTRSSVRSRSSYTRSVVVSFSRLSSAFHIL
jgi:hypothetical protein